MRRLRVLHGPVNIGNQPWGLSRAERRLGTQSDLVVRNSTWLNYPADRTLSDAATGRFVGRMRSAAFGFAALSSYDVLHYYFGETFVYPGYGVAPRFVGTRALNRALTTDLALARKLGRKLFMTLQGCDARLAGEGNKRNQWTMCASGRCSVFQQCIDGLDDRRLYLIDHVLPMFDRVFYLNPELGHAIPNGFFLPYANVEIDKIVPVLPSKEGKTRIVHAPTNGKIKGTSMILDALDKLSARYDFELILVENKTHAEAMDIYRSADLAIDQVLAGWYGGFAVEMMAMGKPVAGYIRETDLEFVPRGLRRDLPLYEIEPGRLVEGLASVLDRRSEWEERGRQSREFVERWHNPNRIAAAMIAAYESPTSHFELDPDMPLPASSTSVLQAS